MSRRKEFLSWEQITSIINADDSEIEDFDYSDQSDDDQQFQTASNCMSCCNGGDPKKCPRKLSEYSRSYNIIKLQTIKMRKEME